VICINSSQFITLLCSRVVFFSKNKLSSYILYVVYVVNMYTRSAGNRNTGARVYITRLYINHVLWLLHAFRTIYKNIIFKTNLYSQHISPCDGQRITSAVLRSPTHTRGLSRRLEISRGPACRKRIPSKYATYVRSGCPRRPQRRKVPKRFKDLLSARGRYSRGTAEDTWAESMSPGEASNDIFFKYILKKLNN